MITKKISTNFDQNTYIISIKDKCLIIDPGMNFDATKEFIIKENLTIQSVLLTHGHYDHIKAINNLYKLFKFNVYINKNDLNKLYDSTKNLSHLFNNNFTINKEIEINEITDGSKINFLNEVIHVIDSKGHTSGSVCFHYKNHLFTGDTLFKGSIGRTDLETGSMKDIKISLIKLIKTMKKETKIYPGHGENTTIKQEMEKNIYINNWLKSR